MAPRNVPGWHQHTGLLPDHPSRRDNATGRLAGARLVASSVSVEQTHRIQNSFRRGHTLHRWEANSITVYFVTGISGWPDQPQGDAVDYIDVSDHFSNLITLVVLSTRLLF